MTTERSTEALRRLARILEKDRRRSADAVPALYVRPLDADGRALVDIEGQIVEATSLGGRTYAPGTEVPVGKPRGGRERLILGGPPSGKQGVSTHPLLEGASSRPRPPEGPPPLPPPEDFEPLPPGFGPVTGAWGRYGTYAALTESPGWQVGRSVEARDFDGNPHPTATVSPDLPLSATPTGGPHLHRGEPHDPALWPPQTLDPQPGQWKPVSQAGGTHVVDIPIVHTSPQWVIYNDGGVHRAFLVYSGSFVFFGPAPHGLAFALLEGGEQVAFHNTGQQLTESRYEVSAEEAWAVLQGA